MTPVILLAFTFLIGTAAALTTPAWQSIVPQLVPREDLPAAVALNSVGVNVSRAVGPALAGVIIGAMGLAAPFWFNVAGSSAVIVALIWWQPSMTHAHTLPPSSSPGRFDRDSGTRVTIHICGRR